MPKPSAEFAAQYEALTRGIGLVELFGRTQIEFTGADRSKFLHNLCTNAVRDLPAGRGCEAFVLDVKGHVIGHVLLFVTPETVILDTVPGQAVALLAHFDRYRIREDVQFVDHSNDWAELYLAGPRAEALLAEQGIQIESSRLSHTVAKLVGRDVFVRRVDLAGPVGFLIAMRRQDVAEMRQHLIQSGATACSENVFETARIEFGFPSFGRDITADNLPQEVDRNQLAISFTKGCYLGQETVARVDALGHVNRMLRGVKFNGDQTPPAGTSLYCDGKAVGAITSECWSPAIDAPLALAYVRRGHDDVGMQVRSDVGDFEVLELPLSQN